MFGENEMEKTYFIFTAFILLSLSFYGQVNQSNRVNSKPLFTLKGEVQEADTFKPISQVNIEVIGGNFTTTDVLGEFRIRASIGDEVIINHADFETVQYLIKDEQRIRIEVIPSDVVGDTEIEAEAAKARKQSHPKTSKFSGIDSSADYLNLAESVFIKDLSAGIENATRSLENASTDIERAKAFFVLGKIYTH